MGETEFKFIDTKMVDIRKALKDLTQQEAVQLELVYQIKRGIDLIENKLLKEYIS